MAARGCRMQRTPHLSVTSIDVGTSLDQKADDVKSIINAALKQHIWDEYTDAMLYKAWYLES